MHYIYAYTVNVRLYHLRKEKTMDVFSRYAPFIQDFIYRHQWQNLRAVQVAAGDAIFNTDQNVLLTASTASGKTEAAFFPILTLMDEDPPSSIGVLYIAPLKALINDQFSRLNELCEEADIPVYRWHGDVSQSRKHKMLAKPRGILQITPESLEAMLVHKHMDIPRLFGDLRFIVIDEVHSLLRSDRGGQCFCLMERLSHLAGVNPRRIGLSATIGDPKLAGEFLAAGTGRGTVIPKLNAPKETWRLSMEHFYLSGPQEEGADPMKVQQEIEPASDEAPKAADPGLAYIFEHTRGHKCLIFTNSREECESVCQSLRAYCEARKEPDRFLIHHGNLSTSFRETAEEDMKNEDRNLSVCTTATLELGIDIGRLERAFQIEAPFTVSSFLQRMGRTGRRGEPPEMWFVMREEQPEPRALLPEILPWKLLQGISLVQLYAEERWVEPPRLDRLPYSLLYHQTMSTLAADGEMSPAELATRVLTLSPFRKITQDDYRTLLRHLISIDHIEKTENGGLIVGLEGERITNSFRFYAVFQENQEFHVRCDSQELGTIVAPPPAGDKIAIAGKVWVVEEVDLKHFQVYVHEVKGRIPAYFGDVPGDIHTRIIERMKQVLDEDTMYPYLMEHAASRLITARTQWRDAGLSRKPLVNMGGRMWCFFPWLGTYAFLTLERLLRIRCKSRLGLKGFDSARPYWMQFTMEAGEEEFWQVLGEEAEKENDAMDLLYPEEVPLFEKYDQYLPPELVRKGFAYGVLDLKQMKARVSQLCADAQRNRIDSAAGRDIHLSGPQAGSLLKDGSH